MTGETGSDDGLLAGKPIGLRWFFLVAASLVLAVALEYAGLSAGFLLGPMIAAIVVAVQGGALKVPRAPYVAAQALVGCLIAGAITPAIVSTFIDEWPLFLAVVFSVIAASSFLGWLMSRWKVLPGTTAVWGSAPGAATAMMLMAEAFGADVRLVSVMIYIRVVLVAVAASLIARIWIEAGGTPVPAPVFFPPTDWNGFAQTMALAVGGMIAGRLLPIPAGTMLVPMFAGAALHAMGLITIVLPPWLLAPCYALIGWNVGLGFTRTILVHASRALPRIIGASLALIAFCGGLAGLLVTALGVDPLTAYLATSPGGMDSVAIIAASSHHVDLPFVMTLQTVRFMLVMMIGPPLARYVAGRSLDPSALTGRSDA